MPTEMLYRIIDEPKESSLSTYAMKPFWPWLSLALAGTWLGAPWFIFNAIALGSPTRNKEIGLAVALPFAQVVVAMISFFVAAELGYSGPNAAGYAMLPFSLLKLICGYVLFTWQARAAQLHEHFKGELRNGVFIVVAGSFLADKVLASVPGLLAVAMR